MLVGPGERSQGKDGDVQGTGTGRQGTGRRHRSCNRDHLSERKRGVSKLPLFPVPTRRCLKKTRQRCWVKAKHGEGGDTPPLPRQTNEPGKDDIGNKRPTHDDLVWRIRTRLVDLGTRTREDVCGGEQGVVHGTREERAGSPRPVFILATGLCAGLGCERISARCLQS